MLDDANMAPVETLGNGTDSGCSDGGVTPQGAVTGPEAVMDAAQEYPSFSATPEARDARDGCDGLSRIGGQNDAAAAPINGAELLDELVELFNRHLVLPPGGAETIALWTGFAHTLDAHQHAPRLLVSSPVHGCAKTETLTLLAAVTPMSELLSDTTASVVFRMIEESRPTLLLDEADNYAATKSDMRQVLNSGHRRGAKVARNTTTISDGEWKPRTFSTWAAIALGWNEEYVKVWSTMRSRCIEVRMHRALPRERRERIVEAVLQHARELGERIEQWASADLENLREADPKDIPFTNRLADNWRPLLAVADAAGGHWPQTARRVAKLIEGARPQKHELGVELLHDITAVFTEKGVDTMLSADLCSALNGMPDRPWATYDKGRYIDRNQLAELLEPFDIRPDRVRINGVQRRGYELAQFVESVERYPRDAYPRNPVTGVTPVTADQNTVTDSALSKAPL